MKHVKILSLAAVAAMALMAFAASSASATALYSGTTKLGEGATLDFSLKAETTANLTQTNGESLDKCSVSTVKGKTTTTAGTTGNIETLNWEKCTFPTKTVTFGKLEVTGGAGTSGTVVADSETGVTINTVLFGSCVFGVKAGTTLGTLSGNPATFTANAVAVKLSGGSVCPETAKWVATYVATEPANLHVEES